MRLTRRGQTVLVLVLAGFLAAHLFGGRALNAVVAPGAVALVAGYVQLRARGDVTVDRTTPGDDHAGETGAVTLSFADRGAETVERPFVGTVHETVSEGLAVVDEDDAEDEATFETAVGAEELAYDVRYDSRGERTFGPVTVTATDVLGLFERDLEPVGTDSVLVYPRIYRLSKWGREYLLRLEELGRSRERAEFEMLREYDPGDPLRDVHWKSTARQDELVVKEFAAEVEAETVRVAAGATLEGADRMAEAVGSLALELAEQGVPVEVHTPRGSVDVGPERGGRGRLLRLLALVEGGRVPEVDADLVIRGNESGASVTVDDRTVDFGELASAPTPGASAPSTEGVA